MFIPTLAFLLYSISIITPFILTAYLNETVSPLRSKRGKSDLVRTIPSPSKSKDPRHCSGRTNLVYQKIQDHGFDFDCVVEAKGKEQAVLLHRRKHGNEMKQKPSTPVQKIAAAS